MRQNFQNRFLWSVSIAAILFGAGPFTPGSGSVPTVTLLRTTFLQVEGRCQVYRDQDRSVYQAPDWTSRQSNPVAFVAGSHPRIEARFHATQLFSGSVRLRVDGPKGIHAPEVCVVFTRGHGSAVVSLEGGPLQSGIRAFHDLRLRWKYALKENGSFAEAGTTHNRFYVLGTRPLTENLYSTVLDVSCRNAQGHVTPREIVDSIWRDFCLGEVSGPLMGDRQQRLAYWGTTARDHELYRTCDAVRYADGRCGAWASLFRDTLLAQGIEDVELCSIVPVLPVKSEKESALMMLRRAPRSSCLDQTTRTFINHMVVRYEGVIYDPSYGIFARTLDEWQHRVVNLFAIMNRDTHECQMFPGDLKGGLQMLRLRELANGEFALEQETPPSQRKSVSNGRVRSKRFPHGRNV